MNGRDIALFSARTADDKKADDIVIYDVRGITDVTDYFVIATAHSRSQVRAVIESIKRALKSIRIRKMGQEGNEGGSWVLIDYTDCVIHVFSPELREYYSLETLWGDAPKVDWKREKIKSPEMAALLAAQDEAKAEAIAEAKLYAEESAERDATAKAKAKESEESEAEVEADEVDADKVEA